jgi:hypothetical protein
MNDDEDTNTFLVDNDPAKLLPYSKRLVPEDPEVVLLPRAFVPNHPALYGENYT